MLFSRALFYLKDCIVKNETGSEGSEKIGKFTWTILNDILPIFYQLPIFGQSRFLMNSHHTLLFMLIHSLDNLVFLKSSF